VGEEDKGQGEGGLGVPCGGLGGKARSFPQSVSAGELQPTLHSKHSGRSSTGLDQRHPNGICEASLRAITEWLDRAMLWLENFLMIVWRWVQQLLRGKLK